MTDARVIVFVDPNCISGFIKLLTILSNIPIDSDYKIDQGIINSVNYSNISNPSWIQISLPITEWSKLNYFYLKTNGG